MSTLKALTTSFVLLGVAGAANAEPVAPADARPSATVEKVRAFDTITSGEARQFKVELDGYVPPTNWLPQIKGGKVVIKAEVYPDEYRIDTRARAAGIVDWFVNYSSHLVSKGIITEKGVTPRFYSATDDEGRKNRRTQIVHSEDDVKVTVTPPHGNLGDPAATLEQKLEAMDPISALLALAISPEATAKDPCRGSMRVFDGKGRYDLKLSFGEYRKNLGEKAWNGPGYICYIQYVELAGFKKKSAEQKRKEAKDLRWVSMTLADMGPGELRVPIKIEARSNKRGKVTIVATDLDYGTLPVDVDHAELDHSDASNG